MRTWEEESCWSPKQESQTQTETEKRLLGQFFDYEQDREQVLIKGLQKNVVLNETENLHKESDNLDGKNKKYEYPLRPYAEDCPFYLRTGYCKFGSYCKFNHPLRTFQGAKEKERGGFLEQPGQIQIQCKFFLSAGGCKNGEACRFSHSIEKSKIPPAELDAFCLPTELENKSEGFVEKTGQIECKYYLSAGGCKYGKTCKFSHSKEKSFTYIKKSEIAPPELNFLGLPIRVLEKECPFYMRNGSCAYGVNCKFHHPDPVASKESDPSDPIPTGVSLEGNSSANYYGITNKLQLIKESEPAMEISSNMIPHNFVPSCNNTIASHAHWTHPNSNWSGHQGSLYPFPRTHSVPTEKNPNDTGNISRYNNEVEEFPQRPGQPECSYFMKTGYCRYASACKFHHPKSRA